LAGMSVIIPTYNRSFSLRRTIPYYLGIDGVSEIIIVDDASTDNTESYVSQLGTARREVVYVRHSMRRGPSVARNTGLDHVSKESDYILFGEDDVILPGNYCLELLKKMKTYSSDIAGGRSLEMREDESFEDCIRRHDQELSEIRTHGQHMPLINRELMTGNFCLDTVQPTMFLHSCSLFRRAVLDKIRFDENYRFNYFREETDIYVQASMKGFRILYAGDCILFHLRYMHGTRGGCHEYGPALPPRAYKFLDTVGLPGIIYTILNNRYFLNKYYGYFRGVCGYTHSKEHYERVFAVHMLQGKLKEITGLLRAKN